MVGPGGLEPPTPALSTRCSNQLSYGPFCRLGPIVCYIAEMMEVKNCKFVLQKLFCVIQDGSSISLLSQAVIDLTVNTV